MSAALTYRLCFLPDVDTTYPAMDAHATKLNTWSVGGVTEHEIPEVTPISDQLGLGACAANTWGDLLETVRGVECLREGKPVVVEQLSRLWLYWVGRCLHNAQLVDEGTYLYGIASQLLTAGVPLESYWPYREDRVFVAPDLSARNVASDNIVSSIFKVQLTDHLIDDIALCIYADQPVTLGGPVGAEYMAYRGDDTVFDMPTKTVGQHAQIICGVRKVNGKYEFKLRNSWSTSWGKRGYAWVTENYVRNCRDFWSASSMLPLVL